MAFRLKAQDHLDQPDRKRDFNRTLFREVAPRYDFVTRALSFGRDAVWKRHLIDALPVTAAPRCLDLACGTGDLTFLLARRYPAGQIVGIDLTDEMLHRARARNQWSNVRFELGDMGCLDASDGVIDIVTGSYALRNAPDLRVALRDVHRVLRTGGVAAFLDFSRSDQAVAASLGLGVLRGWGGFWGLALHGNPAVYGYIAESLKRFPTRSELGSLLGDIGFRLLQRRRFMASLIELTIVVRS